MTDTDLGRVANYINVAGNDYRSESASPTNDLIEFWKKFNLDLKKYAETMADDTQEYVEVLGHIVKKDSAVAIYLADKWNNDTLSVVDRLLSVIKNDVDLANKLFSMFS